MANLKRVNLKTLTLTYKTPASHEYLGLKFARVENF